MTSVKAFLDRLRADRIAAVAVDDYIDALKIARRLYGQEVNSQARRDLRSALASLLATDREQWNGITALADEFFPDHADGGSAVADIPLDHQGAVASHAASRRARFVSWFLNLPRWAILVAALLLLLGAVGALLTLVPDPEASPPPKETVGRPLPVERPTWTRIATSEVNSDVEVPIASGDDSAPPSLWIVIATSALLLFFGASWVQLPGRARAKQDAEAKRRTEEAFATRRELSKAAEESGASRRLVYHVMRIPPMREDAAADAATILSRTYGDALSPDLDIDRTIDATIDAGGRFSPVHARRVTSRGVTVLVDAERQGHPWLQDVEWLLERWRALGVHFDRYLFRFDPYHLFTDRERLPLTLEKLSRRSEGEPLLIISRKLTATGFRRGARWVAFKECWPIRAWLDPSPLSLQELPRPYRAEISKLRHFGLQRFPFTEAGVVALATFLSSSGVGVKAPAAPQLPDLHDSVIAQAVEKWALFSALVPDPTWDQLQAIREVIPELREALPNNRYLQRLLDWARINNSDGAAESGDGLTLEIESARIEELILKYRNTEADLPVESRFETRCRELILNQLGGTPPADELMRQFWELKRAQHQLAIDPATGLAALRPLLDGPWREEGLQILEAELIRDKSAPTLPSPVRDAALLELPRYRGLVKWAALLWPGRDEALAAGLFAILLWTAALASLAAPEAGKSLTGTLPMEASVPMAESAPVTADFALAAGQVARAPTPGTGPAAAGPAQPAILRTGDASCGFPQNLDDPRWTPTLADVRVVPPEQMLRTFDVQEAPDLEGAATNASAITEPVRNRVALTPDGQIFWNGTPVDSTTLGQYLDITMTMTPPPRLVMQVRMDAPCSDALRLVDTVGRSNACAVGGCELVTRTPIRSRR